MDPATDVILKILVLTAVSIVSLRMGFLDWRGFTTSLLIGGAVLFIGGWRLFTLLLLFLMVGSLLTKVLNGGGNGIRGWRNVVANGLWAAASASIYGYTGNEAALLFYLGALNAMFSDTVSTEVGMYIGGSPRLITRPWEYMPKGLSGGITLPGIVGGFAGAIFFSYLSVSLFNGELGISAVASIAGAGILANVFDSFLGASVQAKYRCRVCGSLVEKASHCGVEAVHESGVKFIDNHFVNFLSSFTGGLLALALYTYLL